MVFGMELGELCARAAAGDQTAMAALAREAAALLLAVARAHRLDEADSWDVHQGTWVSLAGRLPLVRDPRRLSAWLATTARRLALRTLRGRRRELPRGYWPEECGLFEHPHPSAEALVLRLERDRVLWRAAARLPRRHRLLLWLLAYRPDLTQAQLATRLGIAPGSVGPLRKRCFDQMRAWLRAEGIHGFE
ncbi:RNA polymerase sigma factor [Amycolatopsis cihanbeyliensis]|uniref:RNA polymerase sigma factor (Sigma-70 family) n=1 Tax=Amycolatopsis cihanbeyliensis TaxID=1128664 RepID=A0A542CSD9_AMYCI|nr:sigma-70 family RNA polymerase sigma factor [Amycolatopsis cihanbeyliensis]TQI93745.1 RNA polymerase sigma factor (sigma-70 family) [Amycolatopsis cihanbeyliensis]